MSRQKTNPFLLDESNTLPSIPSPTINKMSYSAAKYHLYHLKADADRHLLVQHVSKGDLAMMMNLSQFSLIKSYLDFKKICYLTSQDWFFYASLKEDAVFEYNNPLEVITLERYSRVADSFTNTTRLTYELYEKMIACEKTYQEMDAFIQEEQKALEAENKPKRKRPTVAKQ